MVDFGQLLTAMVTPFDENLRVDYKQAKILAQHLVANGSDGLVVAGTTGESPTLEDEEKLRLFEAVLEAVGDKAKVIAGTGSNSTEKTIKLTKEAEKLGVHGAMLVCPYYNKPTQSGMYRHFKSVANETSLPLMLYNVPGRTSSNLEPSTVLELVKEDNIVALKEAAGNLDQVTQLCSILPDNFAVYSGDDSLTLPMMSVGAKGVVSVASHLVGKEIKQMIENFSTNPSKSAEIHRHLFPMFKELFFIANPIPVKTALNLIGINVGGLRLPLIEATPEEKERIKGLLKQYQLI
jgi:4-hydroxy-tetrahydrodipicolinate synthase